MLRRFNGIERSIPATSKINSTTAHFKIVIAEINFIFARPNQSRSVKSARFQLLGRLSSPLPTFSVPMGGVTPKSPESQKNMGSWEGGGVGIAIGQKVCPAEAATTHPIEVRIFFSHNVQTPFSNAAKAHLSNFEIRTSQLRRVRSDRRDPHRRAQRDAPSKTSTFMHRNLYSTRRYKCQC